MDVIIYKKLKLSKNNILQAELFSSTTILKYNIPNLLKVIEQNWFNIVSKNIN